jgi:hypothetical protein
LAPVVDFYETVLAKILGRIIFGRIFRPKILRNLTRIFPRNNIFDLVAPASSIAGLPDFSWSKHTKTGKIFSKIYPNWNFWFENETSGNPGA